MKKAMKILLKLPFNDPWNLQSLNEIIKNAWKFH